MWLLHFIRIIATIVLFKDSLFFTTTPAKTYPRQIADIVTESLVIPVYIVLVNILQNLML